MNTRLSLLISSKAANYQITPPISPAYKVPKVKSNKFFSWTSNEGKELWLKLHQQLTDITDNNTIKLITDIYNYIFKIPRTCDIKEGTWSQWFRDDLKTLNTILADATPWIKYPWATFSPLEDPEIYANYKKITPSDTKSSSYGNLTSLNCHGQKLGKYYLQMFSDLKQHNEIITKAKLPLNIEWWCYPEHSTIFNGSLLMTVLQKALPLQTFSVVSSPVHTWVIDSVGNNYDLEWPILGINNLDDALIVSNKSPKTLVRSYESAIPNTPNEMMDYKSNVSTSNLLISPTLLNVPSSPSATTNYTLIYSSTPLVEEQW